LEPRNWYRFENKAGEAEVWIYDVIGQDFWTGEGVTAKDFAQELKDIKSPRIVLHLNSPGGDAFEGIAIASALKEHPAQVTVKVEGLAASAASFIAMSGDRVIMSQGAMLMIHDAHGMTLGNAEDHRKTAELLDKISDNIAGFYARHAGGSVKEWRTRMEAESWFDADEAVKLGLADEVTEEEAPTNVFNLSRFRNTPEHLRNEGRRNAGTDLERIEEIHRLAVALGATCDPSSAENHAAPLVTATSQEPTAATDQEPKYRMTPILARLQAELIEAGVP
jgi:ATP-dependent protease ClpP protease subunit